MMRDDRLEEIRRKLVDPFDPIDTIRVSREETQYLLRRLDAALKMKLIPNFPNELPPGNPVTALDVHTKAGTVLRFNLGEVQQSRFMAAIGELLARLGVELDISLPEMEQGQEEPTL
ncbi:MAG: hypothetical protein Q8P59_10000 [Dehalococcoidia bacterium]|nr:hypothetical protein [Dehalococcoidia bacterium]